MRRRARSILILVGILLSPAVHAAELVEVTLVDKLDDDRGFCLDVKGPKERAKPADGLQAHTCYSYQGQLAVDQAFDSTLIESGEFRLPAFNACMTLVSAEPGSPLGLEECKDSTKQRFDFTSRGTIEPRSGRGLCVDVADGESRRGRGGTSTHLIRSLTLQPCSADRSTYQEWRLREKAD
jgi:hypothetical protein